MPGLVIFDLDGVIIDSEAVAAAVLARRLTVAGYPVSVDVVVERFIGTGVPAILAAITEETALAWPAAFAADLERDVRRHVFAAIKPTEGMNDLLSLVPQENWCVASNSDPDRIEACLRLSGLAARFQPRVFSASMVSIGKPAPDLFILAARTCGVSPENCIVVEDTAVGVIAAKRAGMHVIGFLGGSHLKGPHHGARLRQVGAAETAQNAGELAALLRTHGALVQAAEV